MNYYEKYLKYKKKYIDLKYGGGLDCSNFRPFQILPKKQRDDKKMIKKKRMRHMSLEEIDNYTLKENLDENNDCYISTQISELKPALYMYVAVYQNSNLRIIISPNIYPSEDSSVTEIVFPLVINHSNLYRGEPANCGGFIRINDKKKISYIDNQSGHYSPDYKALKCTVKILHNQFPKCLSPDLVIRNWDGDELSLKELLAE